jgi:hypothetical protein
MDEQQFWKIIGLFDWSKPDDDQAVMQPASDQLARLGLEALDSFAEILAAKLYALDSQRYAQSTGFGTDHYSVDMFLYNRCFVVARGQAFYEQVLNDPTLMSVDFDFESLLYLVSDAASQQGIADYDPETRVSYETFSNEAGWKGVAFPKELPPGHRPKS